MLGYPLRLHCCPRHSAVLTLKKAILSPLSICAKPIWKTHPRWLESATQGSFRPETSRIWGGSSKVYGVRRGRICQGSCKTRGKKPLWPNTAALGPENVHMTSTQCPTLTLPSLLETAKRKINISMICNLWPLLSSHYFYFMYKK